MRKSKHFRKDVIIARIIFAVLCLVICLLIGMGVSAISKKLDETPTPPPQTQQETESNVQNTEDTQVVEDTEVDPSIDDTQTTEEVVYYAVPTSEIRLRVEPNTSCETIAKIPAGTKLLLLEELVNLNCFYHL